MMMGSSLLDSAASVVLPGSPSPPTLGNSPSDEGLPKLDSSVPSFLGSLRPAELSALGAQLQAEQLMAYARSQMQHTRSGAAARAASRSLSRGMPRRQLQSRGQLQTAGATMVSP